MILNDDQRFEWEKLAKERYDLRYPKLDLQVKPQPHSNLNGTVSFQTFVRKGDDLILCRHHYAYGLNEDVFEFIDLTKKLFTSMCEQVYESFIVVSGNTIKEPHI